METISLSAGRTVALVFLSLSLFAAASALAAVPGDSAYATDAQYSHVEDSTSREIGTVNMITCFMSSMRPDALVNEGAYVALVDQSKCDSESRASSANSGSTNEGAQAASYLTAVVNSTRASNDEPMRVRVWVDDSASGHPATIFVNGAATQPPSPTNPYGQFRLDFCGKAPGMSQCMMNGFLVGQPGSVDFYQREGGGGPGGQGGGGGSRTIALKLEANGTSTGRGKLHTVMSFDGNTEQNTISFAYDQNYFLNGNQCFARDAGDPDTGFSVWRYGLYDAATGARINRNSGFPIEFTHDGVRYHGYIGYFGMHLPAEAAEHVVNGSTVEKVDYSGGGEPTRTPYTAVRAGGKLMKFVKRTRTLRSMDQIRFGTFVDDASEGFFPGAQSFSQYEMFWNEGTSAFVVTARMNCGEGGCFNEDFPEDQRPSVSPEFWAQRGGIGGWSQTLGGEIFIDLHSGGQPLDSGVAVVNFRRQDLVYPADMPQQLYCVQNCPTAASLAAFFGAPPGGGPAAPFVTSTFNNWNPTPANDLIVYGTDADSGTLRDSLNEPVLMTDAAALEAQPMFRHGVRSGRLFTNLADAQCDPPPGQSGTFYCDWKTSGAEVYYQWETGPNSWNQFAAVKDGSGNFLEFDPPLQVNFEVPDAAAYGAYRGRSIVLQYGGFGDLWGIPGSCVSGLTNEPVSCETQNARYVPSFVIPADEGIGRVSDGNTPYLVKWLDREIRFARKDPLVCAGAGLTLPADMALPTESGLKDPSDPASDVYIGTQPVVTTAPRVIHGDVKY